MLTRQRALHTIRRSTMCSCIISQLVKVPRSFFFTAILKRRGCIGPIIPLLAEKFTVIAPDLSGIGDSSIPADNKIDTITAAKQIHDLVRSLKIDKARVVGHDIGLMVAHAYAAQFAAETEKLIVMDAFLPGVEGWEPIYNDPNVWHFRFNGEYPEKLVKGGSALTSNISGTWVKNEIPVAIRAGALYSKRSLPFCSAFRQTALYGGRNR